MRLDGRVFGDLGFLWRRPKIEAVRASLMVGRRRGRLDKQAFEAGFSQIPPRRCVDCGAETFWQDATGTPRHYTRCPATGP